MKTKYAVGILIIVVLAIAVPYLITTPSISALGYAYTDGLRINEDELSGDSLFYPDKHKFLVVVINISELHLGPNTGQYDEVKSSYKKLHESATTNRYGINQNPDLSPDCPAKHYVQILHPDLFTITLESDSELTGQLIAEWEGSSASNWYEYAREFTEGSTQYSLKTSFWKDLSAICARRLYPRTTIAIACMVDISLQERPVKVSHGNGGEASVPDAIVENPEMVYYDIHVMRDTAKYRTFDDPLEKLSALEDKNFGYGNTFVSIEPFLGSEEVDTALKLIKKEGREIADVATYPGNYRSPEVCKYNEKLASLDMESLRTEAHRRMLKAMVARLQSNGGITNVDNVKTEYDYIDVVEWCRDMGMKYISLETILLKNNPKTDKLRPLGLFYAIASDCADQIAMSRNNLAESPMAEILLFDSKGKQIPGAAKALGLSPFIVANDESAYVRLDTEAIKDVMIPVEWLYRDAALTELWNVVIQESSQGATSSEKLIGILRLGTDNSPEIDSLMTKLAASI